MVGKLIVFEGIDYSGKGTCIDNVARYLTSIGIQFIKTEEPNLKYGIRNVIKGELLQKQLVKDPLVDLFAFTLDRQLHVLGEIKPALAENKIVLCDRYYHSTLAYQSCLQGVSFDYVWAVQSIFPKPDLTLILDLPAELAMQRAAKRAVPKDKYENLEDQKILRNAYLKIAQNLPERFEILDATKPEEEVAQQAIKALKPKIGL